MSKALVYFSHRLSSIGVYIFQVLFLTADVKSGTKGARVKLLQLLCVLAVQCPGLAAIEERCENDGTVDLELCAETDIVLVEHTSVKPSKCLTRFADPRCDLSVKRSITRNDATQEFEVVNIQLGVISDNGWLWNVAVQRNEGFRSFQS